MVPSVRLVPESRGLGGLYEREGPQKDQLCGAFWGSLVLTAAGYPADQDEVALRAGTSLAAGDPSEWLPPDAPPRTDYRLTIPAALDEPSSGTSASGLARSIVELSEGTLAVVPVAGPWTDRTVVALVEAAATLPEVALISNLRTGRLWGSRPSPSLLLDHLFGRRPEPPAPDWDCGHFVTIAGTLNGPGGALVLLRDTYPQLGWNGHHLQPAGAVAAALARGDGKEGGVLCICDAGEAEALSGTLRELGFELCLWDNGSADLRGDG